MFPKMLDNGIICLKIFSCRNIHVYIGDDSIIFFFSKLHFKPPSMQFVAKKDHMEVKRSSMASIKPRSAIIYLYVMFASRDGKTMKLVV